MTEWDPGRLYERCTDPDCPYDYAYRLDGTKTSHWHYVDASESAATGDERPGHPEPGDRPPDVSWL